MMDTLAAPVLEPERHSALFDNHFLAKTRQDMLRFTRLQLGNDNEAEDAVQESLAGAIKNADRFRAQAALKSWIIAILKNKVADIIRHRQNRPVTASQLMSEDDEGALPALFDRRGTWNDADRPAWWSNPEAGLHDAFACAYV